MKMRYYKDSACTFSIMISAGAESKYTELKDILPNNNCYSTIKEAFKAAVDSEEVHSIIDGKDKDSAQLYIIMNTDPNIVRDGDAGNILRHCNNALLYFDNKFKFVSAVLEMKNDDGKIIEATFKDGALNYDAAKLKIYKAFGDDEDAIIEDGDEIISVDVQEVEEDSELTRFLKSEAKYVSY